MVNEMVELRNNFYYGCSNFQSGGALSIGNFVKLSFFSIIFRHCYSHADGGAFYLDHSSGISEEINFSNICAYDCLAKNRGQVFLSSSMKLALFDMHYSAFTNSQAREQSSSEIISIFQGKQTFSNLNSSHHLVFGSNNLLALQLFPLNERGSENLLTWSSIINCTGFAILRLIQNEVNTIKDYAKKCSFIENNAPKGAIIWQWDVQGIVEECILVRNQGYTFGRQKDTGYLLITQTYFDDMYTTTYLSDVLMSPIVVENTLTIPPEGIEPYLVQYPNKRACIGADTKPFSHFKKNSRWERRITKKILLWFSFLIN